MTNTTKQILENHPGAGRDKLIPILQELQEAEGFISRDAILALGAHLDLATSKIFGVATFYNQFRFESLGKYHIQVCRGTACHVKSSLIVLEAIQQSLGIKPASTSRDGLFSLEVVACIGACGLAPVIAINGEFHAAITAEKARTLIDHCRIEAAEAEAGEADA
jgi:iron-hydrogenase subunit gamma